MNNKWVKSQKVVNFPFDNFDPTPYLASVPQETILRHKELLEHSRHTINQMKNMRNIDCDEEIIEFDRENCGNSGCIDSIKENDLEMVNDCSGGGGSSTSSTSTLSSSSSSSSTSTTITTIDSAITTVNAIMTNDSNDLSVKHTQSSATASTSSSITGKNNSLHNSGSSGHLSTKRQPTISLGQRKRLVSTSLTKTPVIDGEFTDFHDHRLSNGQDPYDLKYQLYAVVVSIPLYCIVL